MKIFLSLIAILVITVGVIPAYADSPLAQWHAGIPLDQIKCSDQKILMHSPSGKPVCLFSDTSVKLMASGYIIVPLDGITIEPNTVNENIANTRMQNQTNLNTKVVPPVILEAQNSTVTNTPEQIAHLKEMMQVGAPGFIIHRYALDFSELPKVGQTIQINATNTLHERTSLDDPHRQLNIQFLYDDSLVRISNITSNIESDDPSVFVPFNHTTTTKLAEPGKSYTLLADMQILQEGFIDVDITNFHPLETPGPVRFVSSTDQVMYRSEYLATNQTWMDHTLPVMGQSGPAPSNETPRFIKAGTFTGEPLSFGNPVPFVLEEFHSSLAADFKNPEFKYSPQDIVDDLTSFEYTDLEIRDFLRDYMGYSDEKINELSIQGVSFEEGIPSEEGASGQQSSTFHASGQILTPNYDRAYDNSRTYVRGIEICAFDVDLINGDMVLLNTQRYGTACGITTQSGTYYIRYIINNDPNNSFSNPDDNNNVDLKFVISSKDNKDLKVVNQALDVYSHDTGTMENISETLTDFDIELEGSMAGAGRIINAISDGREFFDDYDIRPRALTVKWQHDADASVFSDKSSRGAAYNSVSDIIWLDGNTGPDTDNSDSLWTILHEFGHHVMDIGPGFPSSRLCYTDLNGDGDTADAREQGHYIQHASDLGCAWSEGWADFVPHLVEDDKDVLWLSDLRVDLEQERFENYFYAPDITFDRERDNLPIGQLVEGQVAAALWDIKDSKVDDTFDRARHNSTGPELDDLALDDNAIIDTFKLQRYDNFEEFYVSWNATQPNTSAENIMSLHAMDFAPFFPPEPITFTTSINNARTLITIDLSDITQNVFDKSDFRLSHGTITSVTNEPGSSTVRLYVSSIPAYTEITVSYTGSSGASRITPGTTSTISPSTPQPDTIKPIVIAPADITIEATGLSTSVNLGQAIAIDNRDPSPTISHSPNATSFSLGTHTITYTATDSAGNTASDTQTITITDTTPPVISNIPDNITVEAEDDSGITVSFELPTATDLVDGSVPVVLSHESNSLFPVGNTTVTVDAADNSGNIADASFTITVTGPIQNLQAVPIDDGFTISWDDTGEIYTYKVFKPKFHPDRIQNDTALYEITVNGLEYDTEYKIVVYPKDDVSKKSIIFASTNVDPQITTITDDFSGPGYEWTFSRTGEGYSSYRIWWNVAHGTPQPGILLHGDSVNATVAMSRTFNLDRINYDSADGDKLYLAFDYRGRTHAAHSNINNAFLEITDIDGNSLRHQWILQTSLRDSEWRSYNSEITRHVTDHDKIIIKFGLIDVWEANWNTHVYMDSLYLSTEPLESASGAAGATGSSMPELTDEEKISLEISQGNYDLPQYDQDLVEKYLGYYNVTGY